MPKTVEQMVVLGLDGATWTVLDPMRRRGLMPNLDAFLAGTASGTLRWIVPARDDRRLDHHDDGRPARHGIFDHRYYDAVEGRMKVNHWGRIRVPAVWHLLAPSGRQSSPSTYRAVSALKVPGIVVSGINAPTSRRPCRRPPSSLPAASPRRPVTAWATSGSAPRSLEEIQTNARAHRRELPRPHRRPLPRRRARPRTGRC